MPDLNDHDQRVLHHLRGELDAFDLNMREIVPLVDTVTDLLEQFEASASGFAEDLRAVWWPGQYALALSRDQERGLTADEETQVRDAVALMQVRLRELDDA